MDEAAFFEPYEDIERAVRQDMAFACVAGDGTDFAARASDMVDGTPKGEFMQNTLLVL